MNAAHDALEQQGYVCLTQVLNSALLPQLRKDLEDAIDACRAIQLENGITQRTEQTAHHILTPENHFIDLLALFCQAGVVDKLEYMLGGKPILNSFGGLNNLSRTDAYVRNVHRDVRSWSAEHMQMAQALVLLDDFTPENGATLFLPGSHKVASKPSDEVFELGARKALGAAGSVYLFDSRIWHAAGVNRTSAARRCLTLTFTRSYFKPQFDYCRALGENFCLTQPPSVQQLLGWFARTPSSLHEWYQPEEQRFYQKNQG